MLTRAPHFALAIALVLLLLAWPTAAEPLDGLATVHILAINDLHGAIDSGRRVSGRPVGGAAALASYLKERSLGRTDTVLVGVGDMVGGSPPVSALLHDEPTVRVLNQIGLTINTPGNHEFDHGVAEFYRLSEGGCFAPTTCFEGARYHQVSANILDAETDEPILAPYELRTFDGVPVAFIGATQASTPSTVIAGAVDGLTFPDPAERINHYVGALQAQGVHAFVVLIHEGGFLDRQTHGLTGPITATLDGLDPDVDVVLTSHTHQGYVTRYGGKLVTQAYANGTAFADVRLSIERATDDVVDARASLVTTYADGANPDPAVQAIVDSAEAQVAPLVERVVGTAASTIMRALNRAGESAEGNLIADAFRWRMGTQIGILNSGGLRTNLEAGPVTWGALFAAQPFGNDLFALTMTGEQLYALYNGQWVIEADGGERYRPNQTSGLNVVWDGRRPRGDRIVSLALESGEPVERSAQYSVAVNSFMAGAWEGYDALERAMDRQQGPTDLEALVAYVEQLPQPFTARIEGRVSRLD